MPGVSALLEPSFQALHLLGGSASVAQLEQKVASILDLPAEQQAARRPGSKQTWLAFRLGWARTRLKYRRLIPAMERGYWTLTEGGDGRRRMPTMLT
ncbi:MAG: winged helix-turn-helix domain-containing protein [Anaerolineae bacterium]|nr:winged helix-turn-helix domain-containing protein [Anaerolineae bacterium]